MPIGGSGYYGVQIPLAAGTHTISSPKPVGVQVYGYGPLADGYGYNGGIANGAPSLSSGQISGNTFSFSISNGIPDSTWEVYSSIDLTNWTPVVGVTLNGNGNAPYSDENVSGLGYRFYKLSNGTYCSRAIGFIRKTAMPGITAIADQLEAPSNTLNGLFDPMPDGNSLTNGTQILKWHNGSPGSGYHVYQYSASSGTWTPLYNAPLTDETLSPGEGAYIVNPTTSSFTVTFVGLVPEGELTVPIIGVGGQNLVSAIVPQAGGIVSDLGCPLQGGENILIWNGSCYYFYQYNPGLKELGYPSDWVDANGGGECAIPGDVYNTDLGYYFAPEPQITVGMSFYIQNPNSDEYWTRTFSTSH
jgi:hypothetical protein